jgi:hypothetical protein
MLDELSGGGGEARSGAPRCIRPHLDVRLPGYVKRHGDADVADLSRMPEAIRHRAAKASLRGK